MNNLLKTILPYLVSFSLGVIVCLWFKGCGASKVETVTIEKPVPVTEYVDRWRDKPVRYVETKVIHKTDTIYQRETVSRLDTLFLIDTVKIVEAWLTEIQKYDTTATLEGADIRLRWQNYQNVTEKLVIDYSPKIRDSRFAIGVHANAGLLTDFQTQYTPLFGLGLQVTVKKSYIGADYGFNGSHYVGVRYGRNIIQR